MDECPHFADGLIGRASFTNIKQQGQCNTNPAQVSSPRLSRRFDRGAIGRFWYVCKGDCRELRHRNSAADEPTGGGGSGAAFAKQRHRVGETHNRAHRHPQRASPDLESVPKQRQRAALPTHATVHWGETSQNRRPGGGRAMPLQGKGIRSRSPKIPTLGGSTLQLIKYGTSSRREKSLICAKQVCVGHPRNVITNRSKRVRILFVRRENIGREKALRV